LDPAHAGLATVATFRLDGAGARSRNALSSDAWIDDQSLTLVF
jgi:hypothetical protein